MCLRHQILTIGVFLNLFILSLLGPLCTEAAVKIGPEFQVNTYTDNDQRNPSVTELSGGGFVITWNSDGQDGSVDGIYGQLFDSSGNKVGSEFLANTYTDNTQRYPSVAGLSGGGFVVTWQSYIQDGSYYGIYGQLFDNAGNKVGSEFLVNPLTSWSERYPSVAGLSGGGFVVTWEFYVEELYSNIYGQLFDSSGNKVGSEFQANTYTNDLQRVPSVAGLSGGGFVVTWVSQYQDGSVTGIYGQLSDNSGNKVGSEFWTNTYTSNNQTNPSVAGLSGGGFVVTWMSMYQDGSGPGIYGQLFDSSGNKVGSEFQVNTYTNGGQTLPSVAGLSGGGFVVTWYDFGGQDGSGHGIYCQLFDNAGNKVDSEFRANTYTSNNQSNPSVAGLSGGGFVVTWTSEGQEGSDYGIYGQLFEIKDKAMPCIPLLLLDE